jgi:hypothetical protein
VLLAHTWFGEATETSVVVEGGDDDDGDDDVGGGGGGGGGDGGGEWGRVKWSSEAAALM